MIEPRSRRARALMILGTGSHVGKSLLTAALCRILARRGVRVAPFKSQNMSLNSAATPEGLEIGRAQALQAEAARIAPSVHMNPILLKPSGNMSSQVVVRGRIWGQVSAADYHLRRVEELMPIVAESYEHLAAAYDVVVCEGAGSPAEINLKQHDIVNMRVAALAEAHCLLVGDIDRGGVFASLLGTIELLEPEERARIAGVVINKFRGDITLLEPGLRMIERRILQPCVGVVPWLDNLAIDEEDSLGLPRVSATGWAADSDPERPLRIAVLALPSLSNFTDLDALRAEPAVDLRLCRTTASLANADLILIPGSKQTAADLQWLHTQQLTTALLSYAAYGLLTGICGGLQMLGQTIEDPEAVEHAGTVDALKLLPFDTLMQPDKTTTPARGTTRHATLFGQALEATGLGGYEIHIGRTRYHAGAQPFAQLQTGEEDGCISSDGRIFGTYLHGIFDEDGFRHAFIDAARSFHYLAPAAAGANWKQQREASLDRLADTVEQSLDLPTIFGWLGLSYSAPEPR